MANAGGQSSLMQRRIQLVLVVLLLVVAAYGAYRQSRANRLQPNQSASGAPTARSGKAAENGAEAPFDASRSSDEAANPASIIVRDQTIRDLDGEVAYQGDIDLTDSLARIKAGKLLRFANDGATFQNRERRLPRKPAGYYKEYVHLTPGLSGPGPQRIVIGQNGETYYTSDHYATFQRVDK
jgi:Guanyl-specific ribonuclease Sa